MRGSHVKPRSPANSQHHSASHHPGYPGPRPRGPGALIPYSKCPDALSFQGTRFPRGPPRMVSIARDPVSFPDPHGTRSGRWSRSPRVGSRQQVPTDEVVPTSTRAEGPAEEQGKLCLDGLHHDTGVGDQRRRRGTAVASGHTDVPPEHHTTSPIHLMPVRSTTRFPLTPRMAST